MKRWSRFILYAGIIIAFGIAGTMIYVNQAVTTLAEQIYEPLQPEAHPPLIQQVDRARQDSDQGLEPFTMLLLGVDERKQDRGRSDTIMLLAVNPAKESALLFHIPRDTRTMIMGLGTEDKINHAYAFGGVAMSVQTVEHFLDYPIDYYVKVNMEGLVTIIDSLGGIEVHNDLDFQYEGYKFDKGNLMLDGKKALAYTRMRFDDPKGDLGRNDRQREVMKALFRQTLDWKGLSRFQVIMDEVGASVKTNLKLDKLKELLLDYRPAIKEIDTLEVKGSGQKIAGIYYYIVGEGMRRELQSTLQAYMR